MTTDANKAKADEHRAAAARALEKREESWERSDTDGFLSQWAHGVTAQLELRKAAIAENGGRAEFSVLADAVTGELVPSMNVQTRYGLKRVTIDDDGKFKTWLALGDRAAKNKGFKWVRALHPAIAVTEGSGRGLSGNVWIATKPVCGECGTKIQAVGRPCRNGHLTPYELVGDEEPVNVYLDEGSTP